MYRSLVKTPVALVFASLLLTGCISVPDVIKSQSEMPQQDLVRVMNAPQLYVGQEARFGGRVVQVTNLNDMTRIELAAQRLDEGARPEPGAPSIGRIYADVPGFVDPEDLRKQYVTVLGTIKGTERGAVGKANYNFLVVSVKGYQRWRLTQQVVMPPQPIDPWIWYGPTRHRSGYWGPAPWGFANPGPAQVQTILTE